MTGTEALTAPFPYYGGKRRHAKAIWRRFLGEGERPHVYAEPFAGSLACLLSAPAVAKREVVCDTDGMLCNFWRALKADPDAVAWHADYPSIHQDLTARHAWLCAWGADPANRERLVGDPDYHDAKVAGWWVWGCSIWIGGGWCIGARDEKEPKDQIPRAPATTHANGVATGRRRVPHDRRPRSAPSGGGGGVSAQNVHDKVPCTGRSPGGQGVSAQRTKDLVPSPGRRGLAGQIPKVMDKPGGNGVSLQRPRDGIPGTDGREPLTGARLAPWLRALADRLQGVIVLNRSWESAVTDTMLAATETCPPDVVRCVLLDPPYATAGRDDTIYQSDAAGTSDDAAAASWAWAVANGGRYRIAYCCNEGDVVLPEGWESATYTFSGVKLNRDKTDMVAFSPACRSGDETDAPLLHWGKGR